MNSVAVVPLDIHKKFSQAMVMDDGGRVVREERIGHYGCEEMREFFRGFEQGTDVVMEATFNWPWIADLAEEMGLAPHLADPREARKRSRGLSKNDRKDARSLGTLWLAGERIFPEAYLAPRGVRRQRALFRTRMLLVVMRTRVKNNIHGQLFRLGILLDEETSDLFSAKGRKLLGGLKIEEHERWLLDEKLKVLDELERHIAGLEGKIKEELEHDGRAVVLDSIPGIGKILAHTMLAEMGEVERFPNRRALEAYGGLLPLDNESAGKDFGRKTGKMCNKFLRWAALEAVQGAVRSSRRMRSLHARVKAKNKRYPGKARVAVAREILGLVHLLLSRGEMYQETPPPRPGSDQGITRRRNPNRASQATVCASPSRG